jgi:hypothetical protein
MRGEGWATADGNLEAITGLEGGKFRFRYKEAHFNIFGG